MASSNDTKASRLEALGEALGAALAYNRTPEGRAEAREHAKTLPPLSDAEVTAKFIRRLPVKDEGESESTARGRTTA